MKSPSDCLAPIVTMRMAAAASVITHAVRSLLGGMSCRQERCGAPYFVSLPIIIASNPFSKRGEGKRNALPAANAQRDNAASDSLAAHRVQQPGRQHRTGSDELMGPNQRR